MTGMTLVERLRGAPHADICHVWGSGDYDRGSEASCNCSRRDSLEAADAIEKLEGMLQRAEAAGGKAWLDLARQRNATDRE